MAVLVARALDQDAPEHQIRSYVVATYFAAETGQNV